ncbi:hypothetical protein N7508_007272 [Penicillium antarcticum]|uniref:uncharacterized protein n=1 Tax=Penicillium antarcticum TaxID=416450 RepID=UPI0023932EF0|nr:uncharacterized protein N7508_007272 [Penicillium antarcticum]KAJ5302409.1 hypothetical protein N7508_007272 [Penicillium antarcticum]
MTLIANDLVPIQSYKTNVLNLTAIPQNACSENANPTNAMGIIYYGDSPLTPTTTGCSYINSFVDENMSNLTPIVSETVFDLFYNNSEPVSLGKNGDSLYRWKLNSTSIHIDRTDPMLLEVYRGHHSWANASGVVELSRKNVWIYVVIETSMSVPHPIHLHGHDFVVLARGSGTYTGNVTTPATPPSHDTAMLPENGYWVIALKTDNLGAWLMPCHIGWHTGRGNPACGTIQ